MIDEEIKLDDVTIGYHFKKLGINIHPGAKRKDIGDLPENRHHLIDLNCITKEDLSHYHFHMRHNSLGMKKLHNLIENKIYC
jgi:ankyrin repeat protein